MNSSNNTEITSKRYATYKDFDITRLIPGKFDLKSSSAIGQNGLPIAVQYLEMIPLYQKTEGAKSGLLYLEGPVMQSERGIQTSMKFGPEDSIFVTLDKDDADTALFIKHMDDIHAFLYNALVAEKKLIGNKITKTAEIDPTKVKTLIHRPKDENFNIDHTRNPSFFLKLVKYEAKPDKGYKAWQTSFTAPDGRNIDWSLLRDAKISFVPLIRFRRIYISTTTMVYQTDLSSAVITDISPSAPKLRQGLTITELCRANPNLASSVATQIASMARKPSPPNSNENGEEKDEDKKDEEKKGEEKSNNSGQRGTFPPLDDTEMLAGKPPVNSDIITNMGQFLGRSVPKAPARTMPTFN